jgi:hypothetical protein
MEQYITKIETPAHIAQSGNGVPAYVMLKTRFKNKHLFVFSRAGELAAEMQGRNVSDDMSEAETEAALQIAGKLNQTLSDIFNTYATLIVDWNWIDDETGQPLPKPKDNPGVFKNELYQEQTDWLREQIQNAAKYRATEGNARAGGV